MARNNVFNIEVSTGENSELRFNFKADLQLKEIKLNDEKEKAVEGFYISDDASFDEDDTTFWLSKAIHFEEEKAIIDFRFIDDCHFEVNTGNLQEGQEIGIKFTMSKNFDGTIVQWNVVLSNRYGIDGFEINTILDRLQSKLEYITDKCENYQQRIQGAQQSFEQESQNYLDQQSNYDSTQTKIQEALSRIKDSQLEVQRLQKEMEKDRKQIEISSKHEMEQQAIVEKSKHILEGKKNLVKILVPDQIEQVDSVFDQIIKDHKIIQMNSLVVNKRLRHLYQIAQQQKMNMTQTMN